MELKNIWFQITNHTLRALFPSTQRHQMMHFQNKFQNINQNAFEISKEIAKQNIKWQSLELPLEKCLRIIQTITQKYQQKIIQQQQNSCICVIFTNDLDISYVQKIKQYLGQYFQQSVYQKNISIQFQIQKQHTFYHSQVLKLYQKMNCFYTFEKIYSIIQLKNIKEQYKTCKIKEIGSELPEQLIEINLLHKTFFYKICKQKKENMMEYNKIYESIITQELILKYIQTIWNKSEEQNVKEYLVDQKYEGLLSIIEAAINDGQFTNVDLLVKDIYGENSTSIGLHGDILASSLGKYAKEQEKQKQKSEKQCQKSQSKKKQQSSGRKTKKDIISSLVVAFAINLSNSCSLLCEAERCKNVLLIGGEIHHKYFYLLMQLCRVSQIFIAQVQRSISQRMHNIQGFLNMHFNLND